MHRPGGDACVLGHMVSSKSGSCSGRLPVLCVIRAKAYVICGCVCVYECCF